MSCSGLYVFNNRFGAIEMRIHYDEVIARGALDDATRSGGAFCGGTKCMPGVQCNSTKLA